MPEAAGEYVDIPALLKGILNGYPGNSAIFREYLQNSDDAKASSQVFILDERQFPSESLVEPCLKATQGAALVAINDGVLDPADWTALQKIHSSSKIDDESRTGKNGLGFRASYHLTENPQILSRRKLLVLDAHQQFTKHRGGFSIDTIDEASNFPHQLAPFASFVDDPSQPFNGTVFRLPLRTQAQAETSRIKDTPTPVSDIQDLLYEFCENEAEEVILFLKHVTTIEIRHVKRDGEEVVVGKVQIEGLSEEQRRASSGSVYRKITVTNHEGVVNTRTWCHHTSSTSREIALETMTGRLGYDLGSKMHVEKLTPGVELAFPMSGARVSGRLYTLLPLPISTGFPMHVNAVFALTPDRQSLKNLLEVGGLKSRERLLVEWNKAIFDVWVPRAWAELLTNYVEAERDEQTAVADYWSFWPPQQHDQGLYWSQLPNRVIEETLRRRLSVFPSATRNNILSFVTLYNPSVLLATPNPGIALDVLTPLDIDIVQPPPYLCSIVLSFHSLLKAPVLTPKSLYERLKRRFPETTVPPVDVNGVRVITDFLASVSSQTPTLPYLDGVRWFLTTDNSHVALKALANRYLIATTEAECELFSSHPLMLSWDTLSRELRSLLMIPRNFGHLHISTLRPEDVVLVLVKKFRIVKGPYIPEALHHWLVRFWTWMSTWSRLPEFLPPNDPSKKCKDLLILPTAERSARKLSMHTFVFNSKEEPAAIEAWRLLDVRPLHSDLADESMIMRAMKNFVEYPRSKAYVPLLVNSCKQENQLHLSQDALLALQKSLFNGLAPPSSPKLILNSAEKRALAGMQIFTLRNRDGDTQTLDSICGQAMYVRVCPGFPIPLQPGDEDVIFVDMMNEPTFEFVQLLNKSDRVHSEIDLIRIAFVHWDLQPTEVQDRLVRWLFDNIAIVPQDLRLQLRELPFVPAENLDDRVRPDGLIDPTSSLRTLYLDEAGKIPTGPFGDEYLITMRILGFVHSRLDDVILKERLGHLSRLYASDPHRFEKAKYLVDACNQDWDPKFDLLVSHMRARPWIPFDTESPLLAPNQCRDAYTGRGVHEDPYYYDLALRILPAQIQITSAPFRAALGWTDVVRSDVLVNQFRLTIELEPSRERNERLTALINYLGLLHHGHKLSPTTVAELVTVSNDKCWIPISKYGDEATGTDFAMLSPEADLKPPFHFIGHFQYPDFLEKMSCHKRPPLDVLTNELNQIDFESGKGITASIAILQEIAEQYPDFDQSSVLVPGDNEEGLPIHRIYFRDMNFLNPSGGLIDLVSAHKSISRGLAEALRIPFLSSMLLEDSAGGPDDGDEEEEQMSEDFVNRIQGFLREYDVRYAMNEFLANADDAHASEFSIMLDTPTTAGERFLSPAFQRLAGVPMLVLHNNATFSEADFSGLKHVGLGGKRDRLDTHGRHGLGALSFYYFTDVVTVVSGEDVLFLDPSGDHLPPLRHGRKRTALRRKISQFTRQFPDQLKIFDSLFNFSANAGFYEGTIFFLPLKTTISGTPCTSNDVHDMIRSSYRSLSEKAFFFTNLEHISAKERTTAGDRLIWSLSATRMAEASIENGLARRDLSLEHRNNIGTSLTEKWLIMTSGPLDIPAEHEQIAVDLKIPAGSSMRIQLAIRTDNANVLDITPLSSLFSTLSLPKPTSLSFHVNARFAISSNRQSIVLVPSGSDSQYDPKTAYNIWILEKLVPPLHLAGLHYLVHSDPSSTFYHDRWWLQNSTDEISKLVQRPFVEKLAESDRELFKDYGQRWLPFRDVVFSRSEPEQVRRVLRTAKAAKFVLHEHLFKLTSEKCAKTVDGQYVKGVLAAEGHRTVLDMYATQQIDRRDIARILEYIRTEHNIEGLPLIILVSDALVDIPGKRGVPVYRSASPTVTSLFSLGRFLAPIYTEDLEKRLINDENLNVLGLTEQNLISLLRGELAPKDLAGKRAWLEKFWKSYRDLPGPPSLQSLDQCGYPIVLGSSHILSLSQCTWKQVVTYISRRNTLVRPIVDILQKFDVEIIPEYAYQRVALYQDERKNFASWIRENLVDAMLYWNSSPTGCEVTMQYLKKLPIWPAQNQRGEILHSMSSLRIVPDSFDEQRMLPYQKPGVVVCHPSHTLSSFMKLVNGDWPKMLSPKAIIDAVDIPQHIVADGFEPLRLFIASMLYLPLNELRHAELKVPDLLGNLRDVRELYDDTVPLFARTLIYTSKSSFVHPTFHGLRELLRRLGLRYEVNSASFQICAQEVSHALELHEAGTVDRDALVQMSDFAFGVYQTIIPRLIMIDPAKWAPIDAISFVRRKAVRRSNASYDIVRYFDGELPILQSPSRLVRRSLEAIAWTQRALFEQEPSDEVLAVNQTIGIPSVNEVVEHLKFLATKIAPESAGDATLPHDLKATYTWLNEHSEEAHEALVLAADERLFLNVDDPVANPWTGKWIHAHGMVLHLHYDCGGLKRVGRFLSDYPKLLAVSGSVTLKNFERGPRDEPTQDAGGANDDIRATFDAMRKAGELTDVVVVPTTATTEDDDEREVNSELDPGLRAHLSFLSAAIPHVRQSAQGWLVNSTGRIPFYGSAFGAKALLDFAYTGNFKCSAPTADIEDLGKLMNDLLELLPIADEWDMPKLKRLLEHKIIHKYNMIQRLPHQYNIMLEQAEKCRADTLKDALIDFKKENEEFLNVLSR